ncbi:hypothetical protein B0H13DRAFT_1877736 [Mycena leptocephala]|nr:hypothetical protein B0H13DRAFT_1877736 [Mycena leptocephala]
MAASAQIPYPAMMASSTGQWYNNVNEISRPTGVISLDAPDQAAVAIDCLSLKQYHHICFLELSRARTITISKDMTVNLGGVIACSHTNQLEGLTEIASLRVTPAADLDLDLMPLCDGLWTSHPNKWGKLNRNIYILGICKNLEGKRWIMSKILRRAHQNTKFYCTAAFTKPFFMGPERYTWRECRALMHRGKIGQKDHRTITLVVFGPRSSTLVNIHWVSLKIYPCLRLTYLSVEFLPPPKTIGQEMSEYHVEVRPSVIRHSSRKGIKSKSAIKSKSKSAAGILVLSHHHLVPPPPQEISYHRQQWMARGPGFPRTFGRAAAAEDSSGMLNTICFELSDLTSCRTPPLAGQPDLDRGRHPVYVMEAQICANPLSPRPRNTPKQRKKNPRWMEWFLGVFAAAHAAFARGNGVYIGKCVAKAAGQRIAGDVTGRQIDPAYNNALDGAKDYLEWRAAGNGAHDGDGSVSCPEKERDIFVVPVTPNTLLQAFVTKILRRSTFPEAGLSSKEISIPTPPMWFSRFDPKPNASPNPC